jgi:hypothetical protein
VAVSTEGWDGYCDHTEPPNVDLQTRYYAAERPALRPAFLWRRRVCGPLRAA